MNLRGDTLQLTMVPFQIFLFFFFLNSIFVQCVNPQAYLLSLSGWCSLLVFLWPQALDWYSW